MLRTKDLDEMGVDYFVTQENFQENSLWPSYSCAGRFSSMNLHINLSARYSSGLSDASDNLSTLIHSLLPKKSLPIIMCIPWFADPALDNLIIGNAKDSQLNAIKRQASKTAGAHYDTNTNHITLGDDETDFS